MTQRLNWCGHPIRDGEGYFGRPENTPKTCNQKPAQANALEIQAYQAILERRPAPIIPRLNEILAKPDPALGYINGELRFYLGWAQEIAGEHADAQESWRQARSELESFLKEQSENYGLIGDLALANMGLGDKAAAFALAERGIAAIPTEKDALVGPAPLEFLARVAAGMGDPDRAIAALQKLLSIPYESSLGATPFTPARPVSIRCSIRCGMIRASKNSVRKSSLEPARFRSTVDSSGQTIWIADAHRDDGKRFVVRADEKLAAFVELQAAISSGQPFATGA